MKKPKIILHVGVPKTASTTLQFQLNNNEKILNGLGIGIPHRFILKDDIHKVHHLLIRSRDVNNSKDNINKMKAELESLITKFPNGLILSNESCLGEPFMDGRNVFFPLANKTSKILKKMFENYDVHILVVVRKQEEMIKSYYSQILRHGKSIAFESFCEKLHSIDLSWFKYLIELEQIVSPEKITIIHFDHLKKDVNTPFNQILNILELDNSNISFRPTTKKRNPSLPLHSFAIVLQINNLFKKMGAGHRDTKDTLRRNIVDFLGNLIPSIGKVPESESLTTIKINHEVENDFLFNNTPSTLNKITDQWCQSQCQ
jgi:hypothetical protein